MPDASAQLRSRTSHACRRAGTPMKSAPSCRMLARQRRPSISADESVGAKSSSFATAGACACDDAASCLAILLHDDAAASAQAWHARVRSTPSLQPSYRAQGEPVVPTAHRHGVAVPGERESECAESKPGRLQRTQKPGVALRSLLFTAMKGGALSIATKPRFACGRGSAGASLRRGGANGTSRRGRDSTHCTSNSMALTSPQCGTTSTASAALCLSQTKRSAFFSPLTQLPGCPQPHLHRDGASSRNICTGTGLSAENLLKPHSVLRDRPEVTGSAPYRTLW